MILILIEKRGFKLYYLTRINLDDDPTSEFYAQREENKKHAQDNALILKYIKNHVRDLFHVSLGVLVKGAAVLTEDQFTEIIPAAWELLLETNQETSAEAASLFILSSVKAPSVSSIIMQKALKNKDPNVRIGAILRFFFN